MRYTHLFTGADGAARFEDVDVGLSPIEPTLSFSERRAVSGVYFAEAPPGRDRAQAPEPRHNWVICLTGSYEITASGQTRVFRPGDVLLAEDTDGSGHSTITSTGYTAAVIAFDPAPDG